MRRALCALCAALALIPASAAALVLIPASTAEAAHGERLLERTLDRAMRQAGPSSGAWVLDATDRDVLFRLRARRSRILASNAKLFTTTALLARFGPAATLETVVLGDGQLLPDGTFAGDLYLRGAGDPALGRDDLAALATELVESLGIRDVSGRVIGDESAFDSLRGTSYSGFRASGDIGAPLSALTLEGARWQASPAAHAASRLDDALEALGVRVRRSPAAGATPAGATRLAGVESPPLGDLVRVTNTYSSNFYAETLLKALAASTGRQGTTSLGARVAARFGRRLGARARLRDGSGLSRGNRASPRAVVELLDEVRDRPEFGAFLDSLARPGLGTLKDRMRRGPARRRCRAKTGTLSNVSALSGYCEARSGDVIVFSFLLNRVTPARAKRLEDRMVQALARYG